MDIKLISIIVPAYKQEKTIARDLQRIKEVLDKLRYPTELICVIDGEIDGTFKQASRFAEKNGHTKVIGYDHNQGKGYAIRFGMAESRGDIIGFIDAGMDLNPMGLSMLLEHFEWYNADIIVGSKRHPVSKVYYPWQRKILSFGYQMLVRLLFGLKVKDTQVGMKFFKREVLEEVLPKLLVKHFAFDVEMLVVANALGFNRIYEAPVDIRLHFGGASTITSQKFLRTVLRMLWDTLAIFYRLKILRYYGDKR
ncbi:glycosyltransferase [Candidatus Daviesbacteria bacterium]|nr:glycosyltransferase [Candidatus Daviesbacteria bacterium]MBI2334788.1 glycosyltransferase [Candidatus Daviesbacteria bacterium]